VDVGWILTDNLRPFVETVAFLLGYRFDESDWSAFEAGLPSTDSERGPWFEYPLAGASVEVALEPGAEEMVQLRFTGLGHLEDRVAFLGELARNYLLVKT
jgi:hypothetical protein